MKKLKILRVIFVSIIAFFLLINIIPPSKVIISNPFLLKEGEKTMVVAHRGGAITNPENTLKAYRAAVNEYNVDILESDLYLTKDGYLVYNHDEYIDETCDINGKLSLEEVKNIIKEDETKKHYIKDYTLEELREYNFGYYFETNDGKRPYQNIVNDTQSDKLDILKKEGLQIVEMSELFEEFYITKPNLKFIVEIKNNGEEGKKATDQLIQVLNEKYPKYKNQIVVGTFHPEIEDYLKDVYPDILRGASTKGATGFIVTQMLKVNLFNNNDFACLQIPMTRNVKGIKFKLNKKSYVKRAHRRNIAVQYWTINKENEMKELIELGCDAIMTDDLELARRVIK